jgi:protoporphyrinogen oxidase
MSRDTAIIIGAGPAGLTAAFELLKRSDVKPIIYEATGVVGGISRTTEYKGNRIDIGGHRFFSKSPRVVQWWLDILPLQRGVDGDSILEEGCMPQAGDAEGADPATTDRVMLVRERRSRILYSGQLFDYPISMSWDTLSKLGSRQIAGILGSYLRTRAFPIRRQRSLEDFFINRFGRVLYRTFFKSYTEKLWGVPCDQISSEWGAQRIKGLSITKAMLDTCRRALPWGANAVTETSLIRRFMYPKFGPGQMWSEVARAVQEAGGEIHLGQEVVGLTQNGAEITGALVRDRVSGRLARTPGTYFFSTMPIKSLIAGLETPAPAEVQRIAQGLVYRDFITIGLLLKRLCVGGQARTSGPNGLIPDSWLYIQEPCVNVGRMQVFNNWSPYMVKDPATPWVGLEYFCNEGDSLWSRDDRDLATMAIEEMVEIGFITRQDVLDSTVIRMPKAYPAYRGAYAGLGTIRDYTDRLENLFLVGRNGMHRYNNMDHSMLSAMVAVDNIVNTVKSKDNIWSVNTEVEYHEVVNHKPAR